MASRDRDRRRMSSRHSEGTFKLVGSDGVHGLVALDVALHRDSWVGVTEEFGGDECALRVIVDGSDCAAEAMRGDVSDPGLIHHFAQESVSLLRSSGEGIACSANGGSATRRTERLAFG